MRKTLLALGLSMLLGACATQQISSVRLRNGINTQLHFPQDSLNKAEVNQTEVDRAVADAVVKGSRYPFSQRWNGNFYEFQGMYTSIDNDVIRVAYVRGNNMSPNWGEYVLTRYQTSDAFSVLVKVVGGNSASVDVNPDVKTARGTNPLGAPFPPLASTDVLEGELRRILSNRDGVLVRRTAHVEGEVNVAFNTESTYANFLRKLGRYTFADGEPKMNDIEKSAVYKYKISGNSAIPLYVSVLPYRNGSKVMYRMDVPYTLSGGGVASLTQHDVDAAKKAIARIAND
ncbi:conserved exported protein of unknown function [Burkholderia multivorans]